MKKFIALIAILLSASLLSSGNNAIVHGAKTTIITSLPLTGIIDIDDRSYADNFYALQNDGTIWIGNATKPAIRGPQIPGAIKISGNLVLTSTGEVWTWSKANSVPTRVKELSQIKDIGDGPAFMALDDKGQLFVWGSVCYSSLIRPDFETPVCSSSEPSEALKAQASIPKFAINDVKAIRASIQSLMVLMNDGVTLHTYGNTYLMDMGVETTVSKTQIIDFVGNDTDAAGNSEARTLPDQHVPDQFSSHQFRQFSMSYENFYSLYLDNDGTVWGWGSGNSVERIQPLKDIVEVIAVAYNSGTALDKHGTVWSWGNRINLPYGGTTEKYLTTVNAKPSQKQLSLRINGKFITSDPGPILTSGTTFVPIRSLFESIGAKIGYNNDYVTVSFGKQLLAFKVYDTKATLDGKSIQMPAAPLSYKGRTYVPLRFLAQAFGAKVAWDNAIGGVTVQFPAN
ncbi:stalk domain-containing protein [Paenibacillus harenae]|uniref:Copper amine oxidase-like N-terminal domain-containing protein n=1 Tax=Paenibacillus harenae TaxID=306543 RepID=A0ABT9UAD0_PAEHA|nr:stalk domain-containing protein [Paenibacillus harenae]MDQ0115976.1 hypothetical protein [Paenibacillus harenae]